MRLIEVQEVTKQKENEARSREYEAAVKQLEIQRAQAVGSTAAVVVRTDGIGYNIISCANHYG